MAQSANYFIRHKDGRMECLGYEPANGERIIATKDSAFMKRTVLADFRFAVKALGYIRPCIKENTPYIYENFRYVFDAASRTVQCYEVLKGLGEDRFVLITGDDYSARFVEDIDDMADVPGTLAHTAAMYNEKRRVRRASVVKDPPPPKPPKPPRALPMGVQNMGGGRFRARVQINGKDQHLGYFYDPHEAHKAYTLALERRHTT